MSIQTIPVPLQATDSPPVHAAGSVREAEAVLGALVRAWPVGTRVRHAVSGWVGTVRPDPDRSLDLARIASDGAHGLLFDAIREREPAGRTPCVVCVVWDITADDGPASPVDGPAWMRADRLRPAERRTRRRTAGGR